MKLFHLHDKRVWNHVAMIIYLLSFVFMMTGCQSRSGSVNVCEVRDEPGFLGFNGGFALSIYGDLAYVSTQGGFRIVDLSDPWVPTTIGCAYHEFIYVKPVKRNNYVYLGDDNGMLVYNVADSTNPYLENRVTTSLDVREVAIEGNFAYVAGYGSGGVQIYSLTDPVNPELVKNYSAASGTTRLAVSGTTLYLAEYAVSNHSIVSIDVSTPSAPSEIGRTEVSGSIVDLVSENGYLYSLSSTFSYASGSGAATLGIYDISNDTIPALVGSVSYDVSDDTSGPDNLCVAENKLYISTSHKGFYSFDITDKSNPIMIHDYTFPGDRVNAVDAKDDFVFAADSNGGFRGTNVSDFIPITENGTLSTNMDITNFDVSGDIFYTMSDSMGLATFNTDPSDDGLVTRSLSNTDNVGVVAISPDYAYVSHSGGLEVFDLSTPDTPTSTKVVTANKFVHLAVSGSLLFGLESTRLAIIDIADGNNPSELSEISLNGGAWFDVDGNYLYIVGSGFSGILKYDISVPAAPVYVSRLGSTATSRVITVSGNYAYLLNSSSGGLGVIDLTVDGYSEGYSAHIRYDDFHAITIDGNYAYLAGPGNLVIVNIQNPTRGFYASLLEFTPDSTAEKSEIYVSSSDISLAQGDFYKFTIPAP